MCQTRSQVSAKQFYPIKFGVRSALSGPFGAFYFYRNFQELSNPGGSKITDSKNGVDEDQEKVIRGRDHFKAVFELGGGNRKVGTKDFCLKLQTSTALCGLFNSTTS
ncbi:hypothetical protein C8F04DRAFT_1185186 [Mycena alexandri]|uniref:Uncharacterized protein n=1 Tax=Mycena alexandri TaxID=1745969 RepID=A0AAD6SSI4_9AGAR|nr:hypothetical protein C8F04DRAFT_1185186 [Mycena alexandri]